MSFQSVFMNALKTRYIEVYGSRRFGGSTSKNQAPYYLCDLRDNLVTDMAPDHRRQYERSDGDELNRKMKSLRSSSAMTFNLLGNEPVIITENQLLPFGEYRVEFEYQLPTLRNNPRKANMDAFLVSKDAKIEIYCEMKLAEWIFGNASALRLPYLKIENYLIPDDAASVFVSIFNSLCAPIEETFERIPPKLYRYDAFQMLKHMLAIYSDCYKRHLDGTQLPECLFLVNCVWEMANPKKLGSYESKYLSLLAEEHEQYETFYTSTRPICELFYNLGINFTLEYVSFADFMDMFSLGNEHRQKLQRYIV